MRDDPGKGYATLGLLDTVGEESHLSQRRLSARLHIALGLTNVLIKRCVRKGLIKMTQAPAGRYAYYLTPKGFAEKSRLTAEYLRASLDFFRVSRSQAAAEFQACAARGWRRIALAGVSELAEIVTLAAGDADVELVALVDGASDRDEVIGLPVVKVAADLPAVDAIMVTDISAPQQVYESLLGSFPDERILTLPVLRVSQTNRNGNPNA